MDSCVAIFLVGGLIHPPRGSTAKRKWGKIVPQVDLYHNHNDAQEGYTGLCSRSRDFDKVLHTKSDNKEHDLVILSVYI